MLGHHFTIGYNPCRIDGDAWKILKAAARDVADDAPAIVREAGRFRHAFVGQSTELDAYADVYREPFGEDGHPVKVIEKDRQIMQLCSGRADLAKYDVRRAFVRLLLQSMHAREIEISVVAA